MRTEKTNDETLHLLEMVDVNTILMTAGAAILVTAPLGAF